VEASRPERAAGLFLWLEFVRQRFSYPIDQGQFRSAVFFVVLARDLKTQSAVRSATHFACIVVVLTVVFPIADRANLAAAASVKSFIAAAGTAVGFLFFVRLGDVLKHKLEKRGAAVDVDGLADHGSGHIGAQKEGGVGNFFSGLAAALEEGAEKAL
jgi:hypothetical protein